MFEKTTKDLEQILEKTKAKDIDKYLEDNKEELIDDRCFMKYMSDCFKKNNILKQDVLVKADIPQGYGYKLLEEEKRTRQRDVILRICYAGGLTINETQHALRLYHMDTLYARCARDALIMTCFNERPGGIIEVNRFLMDNKMTPLRSSGVQD